MDPESYRDPNANKEKIHRFFYKSRENGRMKKTTILLAGLLMFSSISHAGVKSPIEFGPKTAIKIKDVALAESVKLTSGTGSVQLKRIASGLRYKKIAFITVNVYVGQLFSNAKVDQSSLGALKDSLYKNQPLAFTMTFLRDVGAEKLANGFKETLGENNVKVDQSPFKEFLDAVKAAGEMKEGDTYDCVFSGNSFSFSAHGNEFYHLDNAPAEFMLIWFGKAPDSGLESLQKDLLK
jgi:hypothetical protein